jgi:hypothetical protein
MITFQVPGYLRDISMNLSIYTSRLRSESHILNRRERFLKAITYPLAKRLERRRAAYEAESREQRRELGLDSWDGFAWAEERQEDGLRIKRVWDGESEEWIVARNSGEWRSFSPCDTDERDVEGDEEEKHNEEEAGEAEDEEGESEEEEKDAEDQLEPGPLSPTQTKDGTVAEVDGGRRSMSRHTTKKSAEYRGGR